MKHHKAGSLGEVCAGEVKKAVEKREEAVEDDATKAIKSTSCKGPDLSLDPGNPPKYCPQCAWGGVKSKVKKLKVDPASQKLVIMCKNEKCPWPFSVKSPDEVTVTDGRSGSGAGAGDGVVERRDDTVDTPSMTMGDLGLQLTKAASMDAWVHLSTDSQNQSMEGKLYCILCQDAHKMTASCLQDVQCKLCSRKGHLRKDCPQTDSHSSQKKVHQSDEDIRTIGWKRKASLEVTDTGDSSENTSNALLKCKRKKMVSSEDECHIEENVVIISDDDKDILNNEDSTQENTGMTEEQSEIDKIKVKPQEKKSPILKAGNYHIVSTHIELFRSNKSSSTKLTQLGCTFYGSFFRGIKPRGLEGYLDNYKLGGDLLKALHMTREEDGTFLYRSQFEIIEDDKKIICVEEKKALEDFLEFLHNYPGCVLLGVDEDSVSILVKKLKEVNKNKVNELIVGFTCWKRVLKCLNTDRTLDLEEYFSQTLEKDLSTHTVPAVLLTSVMDVGYKMEKHFSRNYFYKLCKRIDCLKKPKHVEFDRKAEFESVEVFSSFRPSVSATFTARKLEQVTLSSESDSEPEETGSSVSYKSEVTTRSSLSEPEEVPLVLPEVRNGRCGCTIRKADFETLPLPEDLLKTSQITPKEPDSPELQKLPTRTNTWQKGKERKTVHCPMCYCDRVKYSKIENHIQKVHKAKLACLFCGTCKTPVAPSGLAAHTSRCGALSRNQIRSLRRSSVSALTSSSQSGPRSSSQSEPSDSSQSGPSSSSQSGPSSSSQSEPVCRHCKTPVALHVARCRAPFKKLTQSSRRTRVSYKSLITEPRMSSQSGPRCSFQSESKSSSQSLPRSSSQSGPRSSSQSGPKSSSQSVPKSSSQSGPRSSSLSGPKSSSQSVPKSSSQSVPKRSSRSVPKSSSQSVPKSSSQSPIVLPSGPDQSQQSCPILNSSVATAQNESKTKQKAKQTRGNFRARGFGPFDARGNNPMWGNFSGNMRGFGGSPFVRGNMNMRGSSGPWMRGAMAPRGGMMRGPYMGPSSWSLEGNMGGGGGLGPQGWGPWNQGGRMGGMGLQGWAPWNLGGGMGNIRGGMENYIVGMGGIMGRGMGGNMSGAMGGNMGGGMGGEMGGGMGGYMGGGIGGKSSGGGIQHKRK